MPAALQSLPDDIIFCILSQLHRGEAVLFRRDLCALRATCTHLKSSIDPTLFSHLVLDLRKKSPEQISHQLRTLACIDRTTLAGPRLYTKKLTIRSLTTTSETSVIHPSSTSPTRILQDLLSAIQALSRLQIVRLSISESDPYPAVLEALVKKHSVKELHLTLDGSWKGHCDLGGLASSGGDTHMGGLQKLSIEYAHARSGALYPTCFALLSEASLSAIRDCFARNEGLKWLALGVPFASSDPSQVATFDDVVCTKNGGGQHTLKLEHLQLSNRACTLTENSINSIMFLRHLKSLDITRSTGSCDGALWRALVKHRVELGTIKIDGLVSETLEYLGSYSDGLASLVVDVAVSNDAKERRVEEELATELFATGLASHSGSLESLEVATQESRPWPYVVKEGLKQLRWFSQLKSMKIPLPSNVEEGLMVRRLVCLNFVDDGLNRVAKRDLLDNCFDLPALRNLAFTQVHATGNSYGPFGGMLFKVKGSSITTTPAPKKVVEGYQYQRQRITEPCFPASANLLLKVSGSTFMSVARGDGTVRFVPIPPS